MLDLRTFSNGRNWLCAEKDEDPHAIAQVYKYNTLLVQQPFPYAGPGIDGLIKASSDVLDLFDKQRQIYGNTFQATKARTIVLDPTTVANYTQGLEAGSIVFYINASDPAFGNKVIPPTEATPT